MTELTLLIDIARRRIEYDGNKPAIHWLTPDSAPVTYTYSDYFARAAGYADCFLAAGLKPGELVVLIQSPTPNIVFAFWGALLIGALPSIFPFQSEKIDPDRYVRMINAMIGGSKPTMIAADAAFIVPLQEAMSGVDIEHGVVELPEKASADPNWFFKRYPQRTETDIAFLQHSSGTTGAQKGVPITHRALLRHLAASARMLNLTLNEICINWLPLYHDMGLIFGMLMPCRFGYPVVMMSPFDWVRNPKMMLWAFHNFQGTIAWLPNFAFQFMATRIPEEDLAGLTLSSVKRIISCSELTRATSIQLFRERFAAYGFNPSAIAVMYGAAENVISITFTHQYSQPRIDSIDRLRFVKNKIASPVSSDASFPLQYVSCGTPIEAVQLRVVDEDNALLPDRHVGELCLLSEFLFDGYYQRPDLTAKVFDAEGWFHTGDLGYMSDGELFVTGRKKDLIIVSGKNIYPEDLEELVQQIQGIKPGRVVAFGLLNEAVGTEDIYVLAETLTTDRDELRRIERQIRQTLSMKADVTARRVILKQSGWLIKSTSGKMSRSSNRDKYMAELDQSH